VTRTFRNAELKPGALIQVRVTKPQSIGAYSSFRVRDGKKPVKKNLCLVPGKKSPTGCT
jgi:hypothetical protein